MSCFREMCQAGLETGPGSLSPNEAKVLTNKRSFGTAKRTKLAIRATFKLFQLPSIPGFGTKKWNQSLKFLDTRDRLMHPKSVSDLEVTDPAWDEIYDGAVWLIKQLHDFMPQVAKVHGT